MKRLGTKLATALAALLLMACDAGQHQFSVDVLNRFTPVKNQGKSQTCWAYAMLAAIETEHIMRGDSVHLSVAFVERVIEQDSAAPTSKRGMGMTCINLIQKYGLVPYESMPTTDLPLPRLAFMHGCEYSLQEFARSVCAPEEYVALGTSEHHAFGEMFEPDVPDNWEHNRVLNMARDSLVAVAERAVRTGHGVCWEGDTSERGYNWKEGVAETSFWNGSTTDDHCMAIVGIAHDEDHTPYFIMKNSWGSTNRFGGLLYMSFDYFKKKTLVLYLPRTVLSS